MHRSELTHLLLEQLFIFNSSHVVPIYSSVHEQLNAAIKLLQVPPFLQGSEIHSSMSSSQLYNENSYVIKGSLNLYKN